MIYEFEFSSKENQKIVLPFGALLPPRLRIRVGLRRVTGKGRLEGVCEGSFFRETFRVCGCNAGSFGGFKVPATSIRSFRRRVDVVEADFTSSVFNR